MTAYRCYIDIFPARCLHILNELFEDAKGINREVTLMLALASAAIIVPYERLRLHGRQRLPHSSGDRSKQVYSEVRGRFEALLQKPFLGSDIWRDKSPRTWQYREIDPPDLRNDPDSWVPSAGHSQLKPALTCDKLLSTVRNALAHGNIWVMPRAKSEELAEIALLVFASVSSDGKRACFAAAAPPDFRQLLESWVQFLDKTRVPSGFVADSDRLGVAAE